MIKVFANENLKEQERLCNLYSGLFAVIGVVAGLANFGQVRFPIGHSLIVGSLIFLIVANIDEFPNFLYCSIILFYAILKMFTIHLG